MRSPGNKRSFVTLAVCLLILAIVPVGCAFAPGRPDFTGKKNYEDVIRYLNTYIAKTMNRNNVIGLSIAVVDDQETVFARGFGYADRENRVPATKNTVYRAGSISELFTATAVMQLAEAGKVDIDDPFQEYVPGFSIRSRFADAGPITPRNIMTHHSGLPSNYVQGMFTRNPETLEHLVERLENEYSSFPPELILCESTLGMGILGRLIEGVSGKDFARYMEDEVLLPMGMTSSSFVLNNEIEARVAQGYHKKKPREQFAMREMPAGSLYSNVVDMSRFMKMVFGRGTAGDVQILNHETLSEMLRIQNNGCALDMDRKIGLNWMIIDKQGAGRIIGHQGGVGTFLSCMSAVPEQKLGVIVFTNCTEGSQAAGQICMEALESVYEARTGRTIDEPHNFAPKMRLAEEALKPYEGHYDTALGFVSIKTKGQKLAAHFAQKSFVLTPRQDGTFSVKYLLFGFIPIEIPPYDEVVFSFQDISGYHVLAEERGNKRALMGTRIEPVAIVPVWQDRLGLYENVDHYGDGMYVKSIELSMRDGFLLADVAFVDIEETTHRLALQPVNDTEAIVMGLGRNRGDTITFRGGHDSVMLHAYGYDFRPGKQVLK